MACTVSNDITDIVQGDNYAVLITVEYPAGTPVVVTGPVTAAVMDVSRSVTHIAEHAVLAGDLGADWPNSIVSVLISEVESAALPAGDVLIGLHIDQADINGPKTFWSTYTVLKGVFV